MTCTGGSDCTCGCCAGVAVETPLGEDNRPGLSAIAYRTGDWGTFKNSMLARLSSADYPALAGLKTRDDDDFSIALLDASAMMLDVLTFYQERLANESYLRTATQLSSLPELSRLIGYRPSPGVAASTYLAFTIKAAPGSPADPTATAVTIPAGTKAQSVPAQGQTPQTFETSSDILAKADWNALPVQTGLAWRPKSGDTSVYLVGTSTQLNPGDAILIVGDERANPPHTSENWDVRIVSAVEPDGGRNRTRVVWSEGLGHGGVGPAQINPKFYALRQRASLFGYNAVHPLLLSADTQALLTSAKQIAGNPPDWRFNVDTIADPDFTDFPLPSLSAQGILDLDNVYAKLNPGGWIVLISPDQNHARSPSGFVRLYGVVSVTTISRSAFGVSAKINRLGLDSKQDLIAFTTGTRTTAALTQSEALMVAEQPLDHPLYGAEVDLGIVRNDLAGVAAVAITGKRQKLAVKPGVTGLAFIPDDGSPAASLAPGDTVALTQPPKVLQPDGSAPDWEGSSETLTLAVADSNDRTGTVAASLDDFALVAASASDPTVQEFSLVSSIATVNAPFPHTRLSLSAPLINCYDRASASVNANVGPATAGASVTELVGSGSASTPDQKFTLKQAPLTYVSAPTPTGRKSTLTCAPTASPGPRRRRSMAGRPTRGCSARSTVPAASRRSSSATASKARFCRPGKATSWRPTGSASAPRAMSRQARSRPSSTGRSAPAASSTRSPRTAVRTRRRSTTSAQVRRSPSSRSGAPCRSPTIRSSPRPTPESPRPRRSGFPPAAIAACSSRSPRRAGRRCRRKARRSPISSPP